MKKAIFVFVCLFMANFAFAQVKIIDASGDKPDFVKKFKGYYEDKEKGKYYFGVQSRAEDIEYVLRVTLDANALEQVLQNIKVAASTGVKNALKGSSVGKAKDFGERFLVAFSNAEFSTFARENFYWEKIEEKGTEVYKVWGLYCIDIADYKVAKEAAINEAKKQVKGIDEDTIKKISEAVLPQE